MNFFLRLALLLAISNFCSADDDATRIAECRSQCLDKFLKTNDISFDSQCKDTSNCLMCWESCRMLQESFLIWGPMCTNTQICFPGCQQACAFHFGTNGRGERAVDKKIEIAGRFPQPLHVKPVGKDSIVLNWTPPHSQTSSPSTAALKFVYVVLRRTRKDSEWQEITQTSDLMVVVNGITPGKKLDFKVMAIISSGVFATAETTYYSNFDASQDDNKTASNKVTKTWNVNVSLQTNKETDSVEATLSWTPPQPGEFMIVWEIIDNSFDVKGHLYTDTPTATITLEKACIYRIYVQMVSTSMKSESIEVDTGRRHHDAAQLSASTSDCTFKAILLSIASVTLGLFVMFVIFFFCLIRMWKSGNYFPTTKRHNVTPLQLNDIECAHNSISSDTMPPSVGIIMGSLEKLSQTLSPGFTDYVADGKRSTPPPYEVLDSNPATPQVNNSCQSAKRTAKNHVFKF